MACVRLYRYAQIFKDEQINGKDIKDMDPDKLKVNTSINNGDVLSKKHNGERYH
jgi:hypothetical protein